MAEQDTTIQQNADTAAQPVVEASAAPSAITDTAEPAKIDLKSLDDTMRLQVLNETLGTSYTSLDEAKPKPQKTKEDLEAEAAAKKTKSLQWALSTNKITQDQYDRAITEKSRNRRDIAVALFGNELKEENAKITQAEIDAQFSDFYREELEDTDPLRKRALKLMDRQVDSYLTDVTKPVDSIESEFDASTQQEARYNGYTGQVKKVAQALPKEIEIPMQYKGIDGTETTISYKIPVSDTVMAAVRKEFSSAETFLAIGADAREIKDGDLQKEFVSAIEARVLRNAIPLLLKQHEERVEQDITAKLKNIPINQQNIAGSPGVAATGTGKKEVPTYSALAKFQNGGNKPLA